MYTAWYVSVVCVNNLILHPRRHMLSCADELVRSGEPRSAPCTSEAALLTRTHRFRMRI